jgi:peptidoglycan-associated lipoprotein
MIKTIGTVICSALLLFASCKSALLEGDTKYNNLEYYEALDSYRKASEGKLTKAEKAEVIYKQALCYMMFNDTKKAETWLAKAIKAKYTDPLAILYLADMLKNNGKYDEAMTRYEEYVKIKPDDARGSRGVESCKLAVKWKENPTKHKVDNVQPLNTKFDDFLRYTPAKDSGKLYLLQVGKVQQEVAPMDGQVRLFLIYTKPSKIKMANGQPLPR